MGEAHHSSTHKTAKDHIGKKVVVVGAANYTRRELLDGLEKRGFRLTDGPEGTGTVGLASTRGGGFHVDTGGQIGRPTHSIRPA
jgi:hypothetical protein